MRTAAICPTCATYTNAVCVLYDGPYLSNLDINPLTDLEEVIRVIDNKVQLKLGYTPENISNKSTNTSLGTSNTFYPTQNAVKTYVDAAIIAAPAPTLQQVLDSENFAFGIDIFLNDQPSQKSAVYGPSGITLNETLVGGIDSLNIKPSKFEWVAESGNGSVTIEFQYPGLNDYTLNIPVSNGTLATSVNGIAADASGDVDLGGWSGNIVVGSQTLTFTNGILTSVV